MERTAVADHDMQVHIVHFDNSKKIQQIRLYWDQAALLKQVDVIGARAKNWPIRDGIDQARLIAHSVAATKQSNGSSTTTAADNSTCNSEGVTITKRSGSPKKTNAMRDPHARLDLFSGRDETNEENHAPAVIAPRASAKPPPRDYHDLFVGNESDASPASTQASSPQKGSSSNVVAPKGGAGKSYQPSRLFDVDDSQPEPDTAQSPSKFYKPHPKKFNHFEFGDGTEDPPAPSQTSSKPSSRPKSKHQSQWDFEDFVTPQKVSQKVRGQDVRHFGWSDDEPNMESPIKNSKVDKPRPDTQAHFEFIDDGTPAGDKRPAGHPRGASQNQGMGLYQNNLYDDMAEPGTSPPKKPLSTVTNLKDRRKDFDPHFQITDASLGSPKKANMENNPKAGLENNRSKVVKSMEAQWDVADPSPGAQQSPQGRIPGGNPTLSSSAASGKATGKENFGIGGTGIKTGGDGMGGKKGSSRNWGFGDDSEGEGGRDVKFFAGKKQQAPEEKSFWDF